MHIKQKRFLNIVSIAKDKHDDIRYAKRINVLQPFEPISYSSCSNFSVQLRYYSFNWLRGASISVNLREILNLYIADGYYKYQTSYMNSRMNISDIKNICLYIIYKIKTQNFLNLAHFPLEDSSSSSSTPTLRRSLIERVENTRMNVEPLGMPLCRSIFIYERSLVTLTLYYDHRLTVLQ